MITLSKLLGTRILIKQTRTKQVGKLIIATDYQEKKKEAEVVQVGTEVTEVEVGDKILLDQFSENTLEETDEGIYSIIDETDVIGIIYDGKQVLGTTPKGE